MAISRKTSAEYAQDLEASILGRNSSYDTKIGPIPDVYIQPTANVLELQNERIRKVQQLLALINDASFTDDDLDKFVFNESIIRLPGSKSRVTLIFSRSTIPTTNATVKANFPVATLADEQTGSAVTFLTIADVTLNASNASAYFNSATQRYELQVAAEAVIGSSAGQVGPSRVVRALRPLNGFDAVFNRSATVGGRDRETNAQLIERYFLSLLGTSPAVVNGIQKLIRDLFPDVEDSNVVFGNNTLNVRAAADGGAVDVYVIGSAPVTVVETIIFTGAEQVIELQQQPIKSLISAGAFIQGTDFTLVKDASGLAGSVRAVDGIKWKFTGSLPTIGQPVVVTYIYNGLMQELTDAFGLDDKNAPGRDILFKEATQTNIALAANIKIRSGFNVVTIIDAVVQALTDFINALKLKGNVEASDLQAVVRAYGGVDNFIITNLAPVGSTGTADISISANEYARISSADLAITVI